MNKRLLVAIVVILLSGLLLTQIATAMSSANYRLEWFTPLTTAGGGSASSANYAANFSVGQTAVITAASSNYVAALGYWPGALGQYKVYLPVVLR